MLSAKPDKPYSDDEDTSNSFVPRKRVRFDLSANSRLKKRSGCTKVTSTENNASFNVNFPRSTSHSAQLSSPKPDESIDENALSSCFSRLSSRETTDTYMGSEAISDPNDG